MLTNAEVHTRDKALCTIAGSFGCVLFCALAGATPSTVQEVSWRKNYKHKIYKRRTVYGLQLTLKYKIKLKIPVASTKKNMIKKAEINEKILCALSILYIIENICNHKFKIHLVLHCFCISWIYSDSFFISIFLYSWINLIPSLHHEEMHSSERKNVSGPLKFKNIFKNEQISLY